MNFEKYRIILSRIVAAIFFFFIITTNNYWETRNIYISFFLFFIGIILVAIASLGRMWCSVYIAGYKDDKLVMEGPYSMCRNPLYFFSAIGTIGIGCTTETFTLPFIFIIIFLMYYPYVIKNEEIRLKQIFGSHFDEYMKRVPKFIPNLSLFAEPEKYNINPVVFRKHIFSALWFIWIVGFIELIEGIKEIGLISPLWQIY